jgi:hypothetical protein
MCETLFFGVNANIEDDDYKKTKEYILYLSAQKIYDSRMINDCNLYDWITENISDKKSVKKAVFLNTVNSFFSSRIKHRSDDFVLTLTSQQSYLIGLIRAFSSSTYNDDYLDLLSEFEKLNNLGFVEYDFKLLYRYLNYRYKSLGIECVNVYFFYIVNNSEKLYFELEKTINYIPEEKNGEEINKYIFDKEILEVFFLLDISTVFDLKQASIYVLMLIFNHRIIKFINILKIFHTNIKDEVERVLSIFEVKLRHDDYEIISLRFGLSGRKMTLEEVGNMYGVTRERIRQKESKAISRAEEFISMHSNLVISYLMFLFNKYESDLLDIDIVTSDMGKESESLLFLKILLENNKNIIFSEEYQVLYLVKNINFEEMFEKIYNKLPDTILETEKISEIMKFEFPYRNFVSLIIETNYKKINNLYLKKNLAIRNIVLKALDIAFPTGYKINSQEDFDALINFIKSNYGEVYENIKPRTVEGFIYRGGFCLVDRGTYQNSIYLPKINESLLNDIKKYINESISNIFYEVLLSRFKQKFTQIGISNKYMLKGILDPLISDDFFTSRDYISKSQNSSGSQAFEVFVEKYKGEFSLLDFRNNFEGLNDYVFYNFLYTNPEIIWLENKRFIKAQNIHINQKLLNSLIDECEKLFSILNSNQISSKKLFGRLSYLKPELLSEIPIIKSHFDLFSVLKYFLNDKYYFSRPMISKVENINTTFEMIKEYAKSLNQFNKNDIDDFVAKMNIGNLYSFMDFIEEMSDDFVQYDKDSLIKKELLSIEQDFLNDFQSSLNLMLSRFGKISTESFKGYVIFPKTDKKWNKYLLAGIVRTYFNGIYDLENTTNTYDLTDFIIRRSSNEQN